MVFLRPDRLRAADLARHDRAPLRLALAKCADAGHASRPCCLHAGLLRLGARLDQLLLDLFLDHVELGVARIDDNVILVELLAELLGLRRDLLLDPGGLTL